MDRHPDNLTPSRIQDLIGLKQKGADVTCHPSFEILPVDFHHRANPFQAYIFLCRYSGAVDGDEYSFRKCYARGCPNNLCPHVSQAVMIANRYLQRDYHRLSQAGIQVPGLLFTLDKMMVQFEQSQQDHEPLLALEDYQNITSQGNEVVVEASLELVPAVEHFAGEKTPMVFLVAELAVTCLGKTQNYDRCLACYPTAEEAQEKPGKIALANERLQELYGRMGSAGMQVQQVYF